VNEPKSAVCDEIAIGVFWCPASFKSYLEKFS